MPLNTTQPNEFNCPWNGNRKAFLTIKISRTPLPQQPTFQSFFTDQDNNHPEKNLLIKTSRAPQRSSRSRKGRDIKVRNDKGFLHMVLFRPSGLSWSELRKTKLFRLVEPIASVVAWDLTHTHTSAANSFFCWDTWDSRTKIYLFVLFFFLFQWHHKNCLWTLQVYGMTRLMLGNQVRQKGSFDTNMPKSKICYSLKWTVGNY